MLSLCCYPNNNGFIVVLEKCYDEHCFALQVFINHFLKYNILQFSFKYLFVKIQIVTSTTMFYNSV